MSDIAALAERIAQLETKVGMIETERAAEASSGGAGGDGGLSAMPVSASVPLLDTTGGDGESYGAFRIEGGTIKDRFFQFGRRVGTTEATFSGTLSDGTYYLTVDHSTGAGTVGIATSVSNDLTHTMIPLFTITNGVVTKDYRGMPVIPVRE